MIRFSVKETVSKVGFIFHNFIAKLLRAVVHSVTWWLIGFVDVVPKAIS
ncbi:MAG: hypothetical protein FWF81_12865 [Defluviitaleaceae bacterium]|nr:hypothetical protein [Defluviitaleaceae bacterium]